jgi:hypothetical protein
VEWYVRSQAASVLARWPEDARLDSAVMTETEAAFQARDLPRFARFSAIALPRRIPSARSLAERALWEHAGEAPEEDLVEALSTCAGGLHDADGLPEAWLLAALAQPGSVGFTVAARKALRKATPAVRKALRRAFCKTAGDSAAAVEAAIVLLRLREISPRHPRLVSLCAGVPLPARGKLMTYLLYLKAPLSPLWPSLVELLTSADRQATAAVRTSICLLPWRHYRKRVLEILPRVVDDEIRDTIALYLQLPAGGVAYWQHASEPSP